MTDNEEYNVFEPVDLKTGDPVELTENINEFISRIREDHEIGVKEAKHLAEDVAWILENYGDVFSPRTKGRMVNACQNIVLELDDTRAIVLLQVIRRAVKPLVEERKLAEESSNER